MVQITAGNAWKKDHKSSLTFEEMVVLIKAICTDVGGMGAPPNLMPRQFKDLSLVLQGEKNGVVFLVSGLHQDDELHYNLQCRAAGGLSEFHVYVAQGAKKMVQTKALTATKLRDKLGTSGAVAEVPLFAYKNTGLSWAEHENSPFLLWPAQFEKNGYPGRQRGKSFSIGNSTPIMRRGPTPQELAALKK
jgi:hypothetical protein